MPNETVSFTDELVKLKELLDQGILTQEEFDAQKQRLLSSQIQQQPQQAPPPPQYYQTVPQPAPPVVINNTVSSHASARSKAVAGRVRRKHSLILDIFMICITGGLWIIWMILRPKYY